jgi:hypothetical protein
MKKLLALASVLFLFGTTAQATYLGIHNSTGKKIIVTVVGCDHAYNILNATSIDNGQEAKFFGDKLMKARFAFADEMGQPTYNVFETYVGDKSDPEYAACGTEICKTEFNRSKAAGYSPSDNWQTFPLTGEPRWIQFGSTKSISYIDTKGATRDLPIVQMTWITNPWWQPRPWAPMKVKITTKAVAGSGTLDVWD